MDLDLALERAGVIVDIQAEIIPDDIRDRYSVKKSKRDKQNHGITYTYTHVYHHSRLGWVGYTPESSTPEINYGIIQPNKLALTIGMRLSLDNHGGLYATNEQVDDLLSGLQLNGRKLKSNLVIDLDDSVISYGEIPSWLVLSHTGYTAKDQFRQEFLAGVWRTVIGIAEFMGLNPHELLAQAEEAYTTEQTK